MVAGVDEGRVRKLLLNGLLVRKAQFDGVMLQLALSYKDRKASSECPEELTCVGDMLLWSCWNLQVQFCCRWLLLVQ